MLGNSDDGVVLVGVRDKDAAGEDRIVGVPEAEHKQAGNSLRALIPKAPPETVLVAIPECDLFIPPHSRGPGRSVAREVG